MNQTTKKKKIIKKSTMPKKSTMKKQIMKKGNNNNELGNEIQDRDNDSLEILKENPFVNNNQHQRHRNNTMKGITIMKLIAL